MKSPELRRNDVLSKISELKEADYFKDRTDVNYDVTVSYQSGRTIDFNPYEIGFVVITIDCEDEDITSFEANRVAETVSNVLGKEFVVSVAHTDGRLVVVSIVNS